MKSDQQIRAEMQQFRVEIRKLNKLLRERKCKSLGLSKRPKGKMCRPDDRDEAEKQRRGYVEAGSYVRRDGSERLVGADWQNRKNELWVRANGQCERVIGHGVLGRRCCIVGHDPDHVKPRWPRRDDRLENLELLCRLHHQLKDQRKIGGRAV